MFLLVHVHKLNVKAFTDCQNIRQCELLLNIKFAVLGAIP